ncbi:MAG: hypothetical protein AMK70_10230 [Nitrospira bacterium SG8_35_1]|nr:MAG: hypothetical protein AMK70_10230 [Nitrospira bacterium SG8_35_1]
MNLQPFTSYMQQENHEPGYRSFLYHLLNHILETGSCHLVELGSGSSVKTDFLLSAYQTGYANVCY